MPLHYEVLESEFIDLTEVKKILKDKSKREMTYEQKMALENASEFAKLTEKKAQALKAELKALDAARLNDEFIIKIIDVIPKDADELKLLLANSKVAFKKKDFDDIIGIVSKYV